MSHGFVAAVARCTRTNADLAYNLGGLFYLSDEYGLKVELKGNAA